MVFKLWDLIELQHIVEGICLYHPYILIRGQNGPKFGSTIKVRTGAMKEPFGTWTSRLFFVSWAKQCGSLKRARIPLISQKQEKMKTNSRKEQRLITVFKKEELNKAAVS